jgi:hypothetical protein
MSVRLIVPTLVARYRRRRTGHELLPAGGRLCAAVLRLYGHYTSTELTSMAIQPYSARPTPTGGAAKQQAAGRQGLRAAEQEQQLHSTLPNPTPCALCKPESRQAEGLSVAPAPQENGLCRDTAARESCLPSRTATPSAPARTFAYPSLPHLRDCCPRHRA